MFGPSDALISSTVALADTADIDGACNKLDMHVCSVGPNQRTIWFSGPNDQQIFFKNGGGSTDPPFLAQAKNRGPRCEADTAVSI